ncbi:MAG TPA: Smr/MutS family protein [Sphingomicrobium sp.]|nr:Smr/MutS family protein [Sphingomicrobium sp.]
MRSLSPEEAALWARVASTIRPLSRDKDDLQAIEASTEPYVRSETAAGPAAPRAPRREERRGPGTTLDGSWDRRLRDGTIQPDRIVDLHGMSLDGAWRAIDRALGQAILSGDRLLLLITGHHRPGDLPVQRGAIRAAIHDWLSASRHAADIAAVRAAHRRHGGGGSLYIVLRRGARGR